MPDLLLFNGRNGILRCRRGEFIWIAESDDFADSNFVETLLKVAMERENIGIVFCNSYWVDSKGKEGKSLSLYQKSFVRIKKL